MSGPGPQLVEAKFDAKTLLESLKAHAEEVSNQLTEYHNRFNQSGTVMEFATGRDLADSAWRAAKHGVAVFN